MFLCGNPEILEQADYIQKVIRMEEDRFNETLKDGVALLDDLIDQTKAAGQTELLGNEMSFSGSCP